MFSSIRRYIGDFVLKAKFKGNDVNPLANDTVLGTSHGVTTGALKVYDADAGGTAFVELKDNQIRFTARNTTGINWNTGLYCETAITREIGVITRVKMKHTLDYYGLFLIFRSSNDVTLNSNRRIQSAITFNPARMACSTWLNDGSAGNTARPILLDVNQWMEVAIAMGGFTPDGAPFIPGAPLHLFNDGAYFFIRKFPHADLEEVKDNTTKWELMVAEPLGDTSPLYASVHSFGENSSHQFCDDFRITTPIDSRKTYFYDTFTDTNNTLLTAHTPNIDLVGSGWAVTLNYDSSSGTYDPALSNPQIISNICQPQLSDAGVQLYSCVTDVGTPDCEMSFDFTRSHQNYGGHACYLRYTDANNHIYIYADLTGDVEANQLYAYTRIGGVNSHYQFLPFTWQGYAEHNVSFRLDGQIIKIFIDGNHIYDYITPLTSGNSYGFRMTASNTLAGSKVDNFRISELKLPPEIKLYSAIAYDLFNDYDDTRLGDHQASNGQKWAIVPTYYGSGTDKYVKISGGKAEGYVDSSVTTWRCLLETFESNVIVSVDVYRGGSTGNYGTGVVCGWKDENNFISIQGNNIGSLTISEKVNGITTFSDGDVGAFVVGSTYNIMVKMNGRHVTVHLDDEIVVQWVSTSDAPRGTQHGILTLGTSTATNSTHENFMVHPIGYNREFDLLSRN